MNIQVITAFFKWCSIINGSILLIWGLSCISAPEFIYNAQTRWLPIDRKPYNQSIFFLLGLFKIFYLFFNLTPLLALLIVG